MCVSKKKKKKKNNKKKKVVSYLCKDICGVNDLVQDFVHHQGERNQTKSKQKIRDVDNLRKLLTQISIRKRHIILNSITQ